MKIKTSFATKSEIEMLHNASLDILQETGIVVEDEATVNLLIKNGATADGARIFFQKQLVNDALKTVPSQFFVHSKEKKVLVGDGKTRAAPTHGNVFIKRNGKKTDPTIEDFINIQKLHQSSEVLDFCNPVAAEIVGLKDTHRLVTQLAICLRYANKPLVGITSGKKDSEMCIHKIQEFYGIDDKPICIGLISVAAPLMLGKDMVDAMKVYASKKQPVIIAGSAMPHFTSPPGFVSTLAMVNAENLAGITIMQLFNPGNPVIYGMTTSSTDLRFAADACGGMEANSYIYSCADLGAFYNMPTRITGGPSDAQAADYQAGSESALTLFNGTVAQISFMLHSCGMLDDYNTFGYEKFILDEESLRKVRHCIKDLQINKETLQLDLIKKIGPGGHFLEGGTSEYYKNDFYIPKIAFRQGMARSLDEMVDAELDKRINNFKPQKISDSQVNQIEKAVPKEIFNMLF